MSKKSFTFLIVLILIVFVLLGWYLYTRDSGTTPGSVNNQQSDLFPFGPGTGKNNQGDTTTQGDTGTSTVVDLTNNGETARLPRLRQISFVPTAGAVASSTASSTIIRYIERATGHIYETDSESADVVKISTITIPKVHEAFFSSNATKLLIRYLKDGSDTVRTFYAKIALPTRPEQALEGLFLADDIKDVAVHDNKVFYLTLNDTHEQGIVADIDGSNKTAVFNSTFGEWGTRWTSNNLITMYSKPSSLSKGSSYLLNATNGNYTKIISGIEGLEAVANSDGSLVLFSGSKGNTFGTSIIDTKTGSIQRLGVATFSSKCVWSAKDKTIVYCAIPQSVQTASYPDVWYKGQVSFTDDLWKINAVTGETEEILTPTLTASVSVDMMNLSLDQKENVLLFTNKKDMTVWRYNLVE